MDGRVYRYGIKSDLFIPPEVTVDTAYFYLDRFERDGDTHRMNKLLEELDSIKELGDYPLTTGK